MRLIPRSRLGRVRFALLAGILACVVVLIGSTSWLDTLGEAPSGERLALASPSSTGPSPLQWARSR